MSNELFDKPGIVIYEGKTTRTTKVKKFVQKNQIKEYNVIYLENPSSDFKEVERALKELENNYLGLGSLKEKPKVEKDTPYQYEYRINANTVLCAYNEEQFNLLKKWYGI